MKNVDVMEVRAMLKEILASTGAKTEDVNAVLTIGTPAMGLQHLTGPSELRTVLAAVEHASPAASGTIKIDEVAWKQLQAAYNQRVIEPLFA